MSGFSPTMKAIAISASLVMALVIAYVVMTEYANLSGPSFANATSEVYEIKVPESFGETVSVSVDGSYIVILFENGVYRHYWSRVNIPYKIIWEDS